MEQRGWDIEFAEIDCGWVIADPGEGQIARDRGEPGREEPQWHNAAREQRQNADQEPLERFDRHQPEGQQTAEGGEGENCEEGQRPIDHEQRAMGHAGGRQDAEEQRDDHHNRQHDDHDFEDEIAQLRRQQIERVVQRLEQVDGDIARGDGLANIVEQV
ncbi:hypothetical protein D9M68_866950 [compost metagenome]